MNNIRYCTLNHKMVSYMQVFYPYHKARSEDFRKGCTSMYCACNHKMVSYINACYTCTTKYKARTDDYRQGEG